MSSRKLPEHSIFSPPASGEYDYEKLENIISALHYLHTQARETGAEDLEQMITASFNLCIATYNAILRYQVSENLNGHL